MLRNVTRLLESNSFVRCIFIDFSKAFDTVCHEILLQKLVNFSCPQWENFWLQLRPASLWALFSLLFIIIISKYRDYCSIMKFPITFAVCSVVQVYVLAVLLHTWLVTSCSLQSRQLIGVSWLHCNALCVYWWTVWPDVQLADIPLGLHIVDSAAAHFPAHWVQEAELTSTRGRIGPCSKWLEVDSGSMTAKPVLYHWTSAQLT